MKALVTGASGFVGKRLVEKLICDGHAVRAMVRSSSQHQPFAASVECVTGDVLQSQSLVAAMQGVDVVFHCAAAVGAQFSKKQLYEVNLEGVRHLLDAAIATKARVVLLSSVNVLGTRDLHQATEDEPCHYSSDPAADVKIEAEKLAHRYQQEHRLPITILRPGFIYGPGDPHNLPKLASALKRGKFSYIGSKANIVPIVHVDDVVRAMIQAGIRPEAVGRTYHILDSSSTSIEAFVGAICQTIGTPLPTKVLPYWVPALACKAFAGLKAIGLWKKPAPIAPNSLRFLGTSRSFNLDRAEKELGFQSAMKLIDSLPAAIELPAEPHGVLHHAPA